MIALDSMQGAWRIEESPDAHPYGLPNTHWLIVGDRVMVIRDQVHNPRVFDMRIYSEPGASPDFFGLSGKHGGRGWAEVDGDLLFISYGKEWMRPPRFARDCGLFFGFSRDHQMPLPAIETPSRDPFTDPVLGRLEWDSIFWTGTALLENGTTCDFSISDTLRPVDLQIPTVRNVAAWLSRNVDAVQAACAGIVREWATDDWSEEDEADHEADEDEVPVEEKWPLETVAKTITVNRIHVDDCSTYLWAATSIPIDHSIRVWLTQAANEDYVITDVSVEG